MQVSELVARAMHTVIFRVLLLVCCVSFCNFLVLFDVDFCGMEGRVEQCAVLKFLMKSGDKPIDCWRKLHDVFGDRTMSVGQVRVWHKQFRQGDDRLKDKPKTGRPRSARSGKNLHAVQQFLQTNRAVTVQDVAEHVNISSSSAHRLMKKDLKLSKLSPKFVPKDLTQAQKDVRKAVCERNLERMRNDLDFLQKIVTGDESWVSVFEVPTKKQSSEWLPKGTHQDRPMKALPQRNERKSMLTLFFDCDGVVMSEFAARGVRIMSETYIEMLRTLKECLRKKRPRLWKLPARCAPDRTRPFLLHHDNASSHTAAPTMEFLRDSNIEILEHPANSPDLAPCDYFVFPRLKNALRGIRHPNVPAMQAAVQRELRRIPKTDFAAAVNQLPVRWMKCLAAGGEYFEGRNFAINPEGDHQLVFDEGSSGDESEESSGED